MEWIERGNGLPDDDEIVLARIQRENEYNYAIMWGWGVKDTKQYIVTHWLPLPGLSKGGLTLEEW